MKLNVLDLEMNQPSGTIIQLGAVQLDVKSGIISQPFSVIVNPNEVLDPRIIELCGITQEQVNEGMSLKDALNLFWAQMGSKSIAAWGDDHTDVIRLSTELDVPTPADLRHFNLFETAQLLRCAFPSAKRGGLLNTMELFGLTFEGRQHNALDDARNTARLIHHFVAMVRTVREIKGLVGGL